MGIKSSNAGTYYTMEDTSPNVSREDGYNELMNAVMLTAANDLLEAMLMEQRGIKFNKFVILRTPTMGECNNIPKYANINKVMPGQKFTFPKYYKEDILKRFAKAKEDNPYDN